MRARKKKNTPARLLQYSHLFLGDGNGVLPMGNSLNLEIGCGKGGFITQKALSDPLGIYIGVEKVSDIAASAAIKTDESGAKNIRLLIADAADLPEIFGEHSVDVIYLNFSDPWPPKKRAKRRLTHRNFLCIYKRLLKPDGRLEFKTDNDKLFDFSVEEIAGNGFNIVWQTRNLHSEDVPNTVTEYEARFSAEGIPIKKLVAVPEK